jgi:hypothetical protein
LRYEESVFLNCPFDPEYAPLFRALVFTVMACGFDPRAALEVDDGSEVRIDKIVRIVRESRYAIHDLSRTELDAGSALPRFNMPLELGLFLGAKLFGSGRQRQKACVILDRDRYRYQTFCSDIAGQDIRAHRQDAADLIRCVRDAFRTWQPDAAIPGGREIHRRYREFIRVLPSLSRRFHVQPTELTFHDLKWLILFWLREDDSPLGLLRRN